MKIRACVYIIAFITLFIQGCRNDDEEQRLTWSTDAPLTIPYRVRIQRYERENLIRNPSFETGKIFKLDSATTSFSIDRWQVTGRNVEWTDIRNDSIYSRDDAFAGYRAVKITRTKAFETDIQGDGILSDFVKVIPGNYSLFLYARLEDVNPLRSRMGTRMFDAVDISIQFYDRNKILMRPAYNYPLAGQMINTSFKGLSFANYKHISSFGWARVTGKSNHFPFPEGDIPSDAHFVRIFIGLKGTGTLWIDSVSLKYTDRNFSVGERMQIYSDTSFHTPELFIPSPKKMTRLESVVFYKPGMDETQYPVIVVPSADNEAMQAARIIRDAFRNSMKGYGSDYPENVVSIVSNGSTLGKRAIVFSVGETAIYKRYLSNLPIKEIEGRQDGYFIYSPPEDPNMVLLGAANSRGLIYAALTLSQMIDSRSPVFHNNRIVDYPDFASRYFIIHEKEQVSPEFYEQLMAYKYNGALFTGPVENVQDINVAALPSGYFNVIPVAGYNPPADSTLTYNYPLNLNTVIVNSNGNLVIPPVFHNEMLDNSDYSDICCQVTVESRSLYSGSSFFSMNTDAADILRFSSVMGPRPVFLDNSMLMHTEWGQFAGNSKYYPGKLRLYNIFEPYSNTDIRELFPLLDSSMFVVNLRAGSEISIIRLATAADFLWNSASYEPTFALWKVLMTRYGPENARDLISYAEKYSIILEAITRIEQKVQVPRNHRIAQQALVDLTSILAGISERPGNHNLLVRELQQINTGLRARLGSLQPTERSNKIMPDL